MQIKSASNRTKQGLQRFMIGAFAALAFIAIEAGISEIAFTRDVLCRQEVLSLRWGISGDMVCHSEEVNVLLNVLARGPIGVLHPQIPVGFAWLIIGITYSLVGGICAQIKPYRAIAVFFGLHVFVTLIATAIGFLARYIV
jgi:hypothetical protein